jgi:hypothetical protein
MSRKRVTARTVTRLLRLAYDLEYLSESLRAEGFSDIADGVSQIASRSGDLSRSLENRLPSGAKK